MALNPFFLQGSTNEQFLIQDLINEHLKIYGIEVYYLPRKIFKSDDIIREVQSSKFDDSFLIEAYLNNYEGYAPGVDIMSKFGINLKNEINLTISRERFEEFIAPFLEGISSGIRDGLITDYIFGDLVSRPKEGDLIYFPLGERLFEIKHVEFERPFEMAEVRQLLEDAPGIIVMDDPANLVYPTVRASHGRDEVLVGRLRRDDSIANGLNMWIVADNLRKGAATNAVQIAQGLIKE